MKKIAISRLVCAVLALVVCLGCAAGLATGAFAAPAESPITSIDELTTGKYVMVVNDTIVPTVLDGTWVLSGSDRNAAEAVWTITVNDDGTVQLTDSNGVSIAPKAEGSNGISAGDHNWTVSCTDGLFRFISNGNTVTLACNATNSNKLRAYKNTTVNGNPNGYPCDFALYPIAGDETPDSSEPDTTPPETETTPSETQPPFVKPTTPAEIVDAAYALESGATLAEGPYTLTGKVVSIDTAYDEGYKNVTVTIEVEGKTIQCFRLNGGEKLGETYPNAAEIEVNDTITVTGELKNYNGTIEFDAACELNELVKYIPPVIVDTTGEVIKLTSHSLELADLLHIRYYLQLGTGIDLANATECGMEWWSTDPGAEPTTEGTIIEGFKTSGDGKYYISTGGIVAKNINKVQYYRAYIVINGAKYYTPVETYSVAMYREAIGKQYADDKELLDTVDALIVYGTMAETYFTKKESETV